MSSTVLTLANILYVLVAVAMIAMILLQRGAGAAAGSGFGAGASATVFGSRGSANFLSKSTAVLAILFFVISLGMAMYVARGGLRGSPTDDLGVMGRIEPAAQQQQIPAAIEPPVSQIPESQTAPVTESSEAAVEQPVESDPGQENPPSEGGSGE